jgi:low affinity Fe/Cu permease
MRYRGSTLQNITLAKLQWRRNRIVRLSDEKALQIELETSTRTMSYSVLLQDCARHTRTLPRFTIEIEIVHNNTELTVVVIERSLHLRPRGLTIRFFAVNYLSQPLHWH